jgi:hypothetical protein
VGSIPAGATKIPSGSSPEGICFIKEWNKGGQLNYPPSALPGIYTALTIVIPHKLSPETAIAEIQQALEALAAEPALFIEANFANRAEALDELEFHILDRLDGLLPVAPTAKFLRVSRQAQELKEQLEAIDQQLFQRLRDLIRAGQHTPASLRASLTAYAGPSGLSSGPVVATATSYDSLDVLTNGLFAELDQPLETESREPDMVYYQKTPARIILELAAKLTEQDTLYDLGSGLGHVPVLVRLLSGATAWGVEIEPAYCRYAQSCAKTLQLTRVHFLNADARSADYAGATAFFLFTPFTGQILQQVLDQLRQLAQRTPLKVFSYGPGTLELAQQPWLHRLDPPESHLYQLAEFQSK